MPSYYDNKTKNWYCIFYYTDWTGTRKQKKKRGFERKKDAQEWERDFLQRQAAQPDMPFSTLSELYLKDKEQNTKFATYRVHKMRVDTWLLPVFGNRPINAIMPVDVRNWQGYLKTAISAQNKPLSDGYRHDLFVELSGVFNFAMRFYGLSVNPCKVVGNTPVKHKKKLNFWTKEEFDRFLSTFDAADPFRMAYLTLYYTGMRIGDDDDKIRLNQRKPSKYKGLSRFGPEKNLQRINKFMKERPTFYKKLIQMKENFRFYLRCFYCITKVVILQFNSEKQDRISS